MPRWVRLRLEELQDDKPALLDFGLTVVTRLCETLLRGGAPGLHFYTINQAGPTLRLWKSLGIERSARKRCRPVHRPLAKKQTQLRDKRYDLGGDGACNFPVLKPFHSLASFVRKTGTRYVRETS